MVEELHIEAVNDELVDLESLIVEGTDALVPLKFIYPNSNKKTGVYLKPLVGKDFKGVDFNTTNGIKLLEGCLFDLNQNLINVEVIERLPAGVIVELVYKLLEISGIEVDEDKLKKP